MFAIEWFLIAAVVFMEIFHISPFIVFKLFLINNKIKN